MLNDNQQVVLMHTINMVKAYISTPSVFLINEVHDVHLKYIQTVLNAAIIAEDTITAQVILAEVGNEITQLIQGNYPTLIKSMAISIYANFVPFFTIEIIDNLIQVFQINLANIGKSLLNKGVGEKNLRDGNFVNFIRLIDPTMADDVYFYLSAKYLLDIAVATKNKIQTTVS